MNDEASDKVLNATIEEMTTYWHEAWIKVGYERQAL
jgi:hypothetical protein